MACLPALVEARTGLDLPERTVAALMPLTVTVFRFGNVFGGVAAGLIGGRLYGVDPGLPSIAGHRHGGPWPISAWWGYRARRCCWPAGPIYNALGVPIRP